MFSLTLDINLLSQLIIKQKLATLYIDFKLFSNNTIAFNSNQFDILSNKISFVFEFSKRNQFGKPIILQDNWSYTFFSFTPSRNKFN